MAMHNYSNHHEREHESRREKELQEAIAAEKWQIERVKQLAQQMAEECPLVWRFGDGDGGSVRNYVYDAFERAGLRDSPASWNPPAGNKEQDGEHTVYRLYDAEGVLLYVGVTNSLSKRWSQHEKTKPWFGEVAVITRSLYPDKRSAYEAEVRAIISESPIHNIAHNRASDRGRA